ncbi:MAG: sugar phosphate isomerase/epimerase [Clostridia bacterium]|nr:sugar phosphate isomerase/epimerase [Clostridia bacterium]
MKYSVFHHHICRAAEEKGCTVDDMFSEVHAWGIDYVELDRDAIGTEDAEILALSRQLKKHGLQPSSIYGFYDWARGDMPGEDDLLLRQAALLDCPRIMIIPGFYSDLANQEQCSVEKARMISGTRRIVALAAARGLTVTIECFDDARSPIATIEGMAAFLQAVPQLQVTLETGNFRFSGDDILVAQQRFRDRIRHVHLKDRFLPAQSEDSMGQTLQTGAPVTAATGELLFPCAVGQGHIPIAQVISTLVQQRYDGVMTIEHFGVASYAAAIRASIDWLKEREKNL